MIMDKEIRILILEDVDVEAELEEHELRKAGLVFTSKVVDTREAFLKELDGFLPDLILLDYDLPSLDGLAALRIAKEKCPDVPFILVTGKLGEEFAIENLKEGATDYVLKGNLRRLVPTIKRALEEAKLITERKQAYKALRESEERYRKQFEEAIDAIFLADLGTGMIVDCNIAASKLVEREKSEIIGKHQSFLHPAEDIKDGFSKTFKSHMTGESSDRLEDRVITKSGQIKDVAIRASKITIEGKEVMQGIFRDITERKRAEQALRESEERYSTMANFSPNVVLVHKGGTIHYINESGIKILGYLRDEIIGKTVFEFISDDSKELVAKNMQRRISGEHVENYEVKVITKSKDIKYFLVNAAIIPYEKEKAFLVVLSDITERKQAEEKIRQKMSEMERLKKRLYI